MLQKCGSEQRVCAAQDTRDVKILTERRLSVEQGVCEGVVQGRQSIHRSVLSRVIWSALHLADPPVEQGVY